MLELNRMRAKVFDGNEFAGNREKILKKKISELGFTPKMVSVFFAEDMGSVLYTNLKQQAADRLGVNFHPEEVTLETPLKSIKQIINHYSKSGEFQAVMVQKPSRDSVIGLSEVNKLGFKNWWERITAEINIEKDMDCLHPVNLERIYRGNWKIIPGTARAVISILESGKIPFKGKETAVVGKSDLVGKPLAYVLAQNGAQVYLCGSEGLVARNIGSQFTKEVEPEDLESVVGEAEIVISATGKVNLIKGRMIKKGAVVIDVGWPVGDVEFLTVKEEASFVTPVPGGVGPVTVISLMENLLDLI